MNDQELVETFTSRRAARLKKSWTTYPARNPVASDLHDCRRYMVLRQVAWEIRPAPDTEGLETIENGNVKERPMIEQLRAEGWEIVQEQAPFEILQPLRPGGERRMIVRGKIDGMIALGKNDLLPFDTKDTSPWTIESIDSAADLDQSIWTRKWKRQGLTYALGMNQPRFAFVLGNRGTRKIILLRLDDHLEEAERILAVCTWTVGMADELARIGATWETADSALTERGVPYHADFAICRGCWLKDRACFPPDPAKSLRVAMRPELEPLVTRYLAAQPAASEYEKMKKALKAATEGAPTVVAGNFVIDGEVKTRRMKAQPARPEHVQEHWSFAIRRVGERGPASAEEETP